MFCRPTAMSERGESLPTQETNQTGAAGDVSSPLTPTVHAHSTFGQEFRLTCPVCLQDLKKPRQLKSCYHIFCSECLKPFIEIEDSEIKCPICKMKSSKEEVSKALNTDSYLFAYRGQLCIHAESNDISCSSESHDSSFPANYFCLECGRNFCRPCHIDHSDTADFHTHHCLHLSKIHEEAMTVGINRNREEPETAVPVSDEEEDQVDHLPKGKCPICRNTDLCQHEHWLRDLLSSTFRLNDTCSIKSHEDGNKLIAYCTDCEELICRNCSMIQHKIHETKIIEAAEEEKRVSIRSQKKELCFKQEIFADAAKSVDMAETNFRHHILQIQQEMIKRKQSVLVQTEKAFDAAFQLIKETGQKQAELNRQSSEMHQEKEFLNTAIKLAEGALEGSENALEVIRVWKGLSVILKGLRGEKETDPVVPQNIVEKRLVLPAPNCMNPDLRILQKVGVEGTLLRESFILKAQEPLLLFYSILPLTETEAFVSCKPEACTSSIVQYSNINPRHYTIKLKDAGEYCIIAVPGNGIVATLYQEAGVCGCKGDRKQVLFWNRALDRSMSELEAENAAGELTLITETDLPPRSVAVTRDHHLVVCMACNLTGKCRIQLMTMRGDNLCSKDLTSPRAQHASNHFPRYVTVNINDDICITDEKNQSIIILSSNLENKVRICNPYTEDALNKNFSPKGICHDSFGRLIIADANNHRVLRIELNDSKVNGEPQTILMNGVNGVKDLNDPTLVALGPGPKLWVVCRDKIQVFDYMEKV